MIESGRIGTGKIGAANQASVWKSPILGILLNKGGAHCRPTDKSEERKYIDSLFAVVYHIVYKFTKAKHRWGVVAVLPLYRERSRHGLQGSAWETSIGEVAPELQIGRPGPEPSSAVLPCFKAMGLE